MDDYTIEVLKVPANTSKLTVSSTRVTLKISQRHFEKYPIEIWESIAYRCKDIPVKNTHRGTIFINLFGFVGHIHTENDKSKIAVSYYGEIDTFIWKVIGE